MPFTPSRADGVEGARLLVEQVTGGNGNATIYSGRQNEEQQEKVG